jgi:membrane-associated phospholipid phosphatase
MSIEAGHSSRSRFFLENIRSRSKDAIRGLFIWFTSLMVTATIVAISFQWLDRPIALLAHRVPRSSTNGTWEWLTRIPNPLIPLALIAFVVLGLRALLGRSLSNRQAVAFVCSLSVIVTETAKDQLKFLFGRTWPESWMGNNPSFIRDGVYGFNFLHGGGAYQSFPSGHMAAACAVLSVLWICYPRLKWLWVAGGLAVGAGLVGGNYHFLGDVIAGGFLGISAGWLVSSIWKMSGLSPSPKRNG